MPEPIESQYFVAGHITRSHGVDGTVLIVPVVEVADPALFNDVTLVRLQNERGDLIPARIGSVKVQQKDDRISFFVKFEHINNRNEAERITRTPVFVEKDQVKNILAESHSWISFEAYNERDDYMGTVEGVIQNPAQSILEISTGDGYKLVPCVDHYIAAVDEDSGVVRFKNMDQLEGL